MQFKSSTLFFLFYSIVLIILLILDPSVIIQASGSSSILINEVLYDPVGSDSGYEWIEIYNTLETPINLESWKIQVAGTTFTDSATLSSATVQPKSYFLICESKVTGCDMYVTKLAFQNGGGATDGIQILDSKSNVVDIVVYDTPNINSLTNESAVIIPDSQCAEKSPSGQSIGRKNLIDTDNSYADFYIFESPTPGEENPLSDSLAPTGEFPFIPIALLLFILLPRSARLSRY